MEKNENIWIWVAGIGAIALAVWYFVGKFFRKVSDAINCWQLLDTASNELDFREIWGHHTYLS